MKAINEKFQEGLDSIVNSPGWIKIYNERAGEPNTFRVGKKANIRRLTNRQ